MKVLVAITGASGAVYGKKIVEQLRHLDVETKVIVTDAAKEVAKYENVKLPKPDYKDSDLAAQPASGTSAPDVMIIIPCSLKTLGKVANGICDSLTARTAEVMLKERKKLILVVRETPLSYITIENMRKITLAGGIVLPACPGFYHKPKTVDDLVDFIVAKTLNTAGIEHNINIKWKGNKQKRNKRGE